MILLAIFTLGISMSASVHAVKKDDAVSFYSSAAPVLQTVQESSSLIPKTDSNGVCLREWVAFSCLGHSSSIAKAGDRFVVVTSGQLDKSDPRSILIVQKSGDTWSEAIVLNRPSEFSGDPKAFSSSPILCKVFPFDPTSNEYLLFFRVGTGYETQQMQSLVFRSFDGCKSFTREALPNGITGPTKCKPLYFGNYLVFGSSLERGDTKNKDGQSSTSARIEVYDVRTKSWYQSPELATDMPFGAIEPTFCAYEKDGIPMIRMFCRNRSHGFALTTEFTLSEDPTSILWPSKLELSTLPNCDSGLDLMDLSGKTIKGKVIDNGTVIAFGNFLGSRKSLEMAVSSDGGQTWSKPIVLDQDGGEFPACYFDDTSGRIHVTYASNKPNMPLSKENQTIRHLELNPEEILIQGKFLNSMIFNGL